MSSILKALEKVEDEQNARRSGGSTGLGRRREKRAAWIIPACVVGGAAVASLVTFAAMGGFSGSRTPAAVSEMKVAAPTAAATQAVPAVPAAPVAPEAPAAPAPVATVAPAVQASPATAAAPAAHAAKAAVVPVRPVATAPAPSKAPLVQKAAVPPAKAVATAKSKQQAMPDIRQPAPAGTRPPVAASAKVAPAPVPQPAPVVAAAAVPQEQPRQPVRQEPKVTGIAWQGSSESSFAMVDGRPLRQGAAVDGYKIERIFEDSVRFSGANGIVTVPLGAGE